MLISRAEIAISSRLKLKTQNLFLAPIFACDLNFVA
jgi:hypothetical protein